MRMLALDEVEAVSGGASDGLFVIQNQATWGTQFSGGALFGTGSGISGFEGFKAWLEDQGVILEVVVTAPKMTDQEKLAYDAAKARAEANLFLAENAIVGGSIYAGLSASKAVATLLGLLGFNAGTKYTAEERAALLERMTQMEFEMDGMDGSHDGIVYYQSPFFGSP